MTSRRTFLHLGGVAGWTLLSSPLRTAWAQSQDHTSHAGHVPTPAVTQVAFPSPVIRTADAFTNPLFVPGNSGLLGVMAVQAPLRLTVGGAKQPVVPGKSPANLLVYGSEQGGVQRANPTLLTKKGQVVEVALNNGLPEPTIIHWHGLLVDGKTDGGPQLSIPQGGEYRYRFEVRNRAGMYWYHPHPHSTAARQAYSGLAGLFFVDDDEEQAVREKLGLKLGDNDLPLVIQDKRIDADGQLVYRPTDEEWKGGYLGNEVLVNLTVAPLLKATPRWYRLRMLNGSTARIFNLAFFHGERDLPFDVIGTDSGLLRRAQTAKRAFLSPGERLDVLVNLAQVPAGQFVMLKSLAFDPMHQEGGHAGHGGSGAAINWPDGAEIPLLKIAVDGAAVSTPAPLPDVLSRFDDIKVSNAKIRPWKLGWNGKDWLLNGKTFQMSEVAATVRRNDVEIWELQNESQGMPHPMHIHGFVFQVVSRQASPKQQAELAVDRTGRSVSDLGWKDTVLVWPGETVRVAIDFNHPHAGAQTFMFHCHNLEHEDKGMMVNFRVA